MRIVFIGTGDIGIPTLEMLLRSPKHTVAAVVTQPDKPAGRRMELRVSPIKGLALRHGVPVLQPQRIREPEAVEQVRAFGPEVIVVMAYGQILPKALLEVPTVACLNLHASLLPRHRGAAPIQAAILAGDAETGITVMYVDVGLDTGDVLLKKGIPIHRHETGGSLHNRLAVLAPTALAEALALLREGHAPRVPQDPVNATYASKLAREHGVIDWARPAAEIVRAIRAMNPWPGAFTMLPADSGPARKLKVFSAALNRCRRGGEPGEILRAGERGILVATGEGAVLLREVQLEGRTRMTAGAFLRGHPVAIGMILRV